jgi:hypothetical protein
MTRKSVFSAPLSSRAPLSASVCAGFRLHMCACCLIASFPSWSNACATFLLIGCLCSLCVEQSVMVSIQSLMDDRPYHNEPGFEKASVTMHHLRVFKSGAGVPCRVAA